MSSPLESTREIDLDAVAPHTTVEESRAPASAANSPLPAVGTNEVREWGMWDPNLWWTDWALPPDPRPSWEQWFEWINQLKALTPALGEASQDWQTMATQMEDSLATVRTMRADLASWTGPSAQTMSDSLDRLEESITTKSAAIRENPGRLQDLAQTINDAVPPMTALDAEYQQVLQDLNACRQVAERGQPIMLNLATKLLQVGTDVENSVRTDNLAPQPVQPQALALGSGPQGPTQQLTQVAGSGAAGVGSISTAAPVPTAEQPGVAPAGDLTGLTPVQAAQGTATGPLPGVSVGAVDPTVAPVPTTADPTLASASPTLAGASVAPAATPAMSAAPIAAAPAAVPTGSAMMPVAPIAAPAMLASGGSPDRKDDKDTAVVVGAPVPTGGTPVTAAAGVPAGLRGRTRTQSSVKVSVTVRTPARKPAQDTAEK